VNAESVNDESDRYRRHNLIDWFSQQEVSAARIAVVGAGAIGNEVVKNLALLGVGQIDVYDFDTVEIHNLTRSVLLRERDIGTSKAQAVVSRAAELDPNCRLRAFTGDIRDTLNPSALSAYRAVVSAVDNFDARLRLNQLCLLAGVDLVNSAIDSRFVSLEVFAHSQWDVACYECHLPESAYQRMAQRYSCGGLLKRAFVEQKVPTTTITASLAGAMAAAAALGLGQSKRTGSADLDDHGQSNSSRRVFLDSHTMISQAASLKRQPGCAACSGFERRPERGHLADFIAASASAEDVDATATKAATKAADDNTVPVVLPEPIITAYGCTQCGNQRGMRGTASDLIGQRVRQFDDQLSWCPTCQTASMAVEIRERFELTELISLLAQMPTLRAPVPFALVQFASATQFIEWDAAPHKSMKDPTWPMN
jgi:molybdopterin-synthase adenylyltransferase